MAKEEGQGVMLSSFSCGELGYGYPICKDKLAEINKICEGQHYSDKEAAKIKLNTSRKPKLQSTPFVREFGCGSNGDGYWTYKSIAIQI